MDVRGSEIVNFWLNTAKDYHCSQNLNTESKGKLFLKTREVINKILKADSPETLMLRNEILQNFCKLNAKQFKKITNLVNAMGERGLKKLDRLFQVITLDSKDRPNFPTVKFSALKSQTKLSDSVEISDNHRKINDFRKNLYDGLREKRKISNPTEEFIPLTSDIIHHLKSNYLDDLSIVRLNQTTKVLKKNISREDINKVDLIKMLNDEGVSPRELNLITIKDFINFFGKDLDKIRTLKVGEQDGIVENLDADELTITFLKEIIEKFPNLNKLDISDVLETNLANALSFNKLEELNNFKHLKSLTFKDLTRVKSLDFLQSLPEIDSLKIRNCLDLKIIDAKKNLLKLKNLSIKYFHKIINLDSLIMLESLKLIPDGDFKLNISNLIKLKHLTFCCYKYNVVDLIGLEKLVDLEEIKLMLPNADLINFESLKNLKSISLIDCPGKFFGFDKINKLKELSVKNCINLKDYSFLSRTPLLKKLSADKLNNSNTQNISLLQNIEDLSLLNFKGTHLEFLRELKTLKKLTIEDQEDRGKIQDVNILGILPIEHLRFTKRGNSDLDLLILNSLKDIPTLKYLQLVGIENLNLSFLTGHPSLEKIHIRADAIIHPECLMEIPALKYININHKHMTKPLKKKGIIVRSY